MRCGSFIAHNLKMIVVSAMVSSHHDLNNLKFIGEEDGSDSEDDTGVSESSVDCFEQGSELVVLPRPEIG